MAEKSKVGPYNTVAERLPIKSTAVTALAVGNAKLEKLARDYTELLSPPQQGKAAYKLADYIIKKRNLNKSSPPPKYYEPALEFKKNYDSQKCYICGYKIANKARVEELEHLLPIAEALQFDFIIQKQLTDDILEKIYNTHLAHGYLLEYGRSHRCCNQLKSGTSFLTFDGRPPFNRPYKINKNEISMLLRNIWENVTVKKGKFNEDYGCKEPELIRNIATITKERFITNRTQILIDYYFQPLLDMVYLKINSWGQGSYPFAQLVMISNQVMLMDQKIWNVVGMQFTGQKMSQTEMIMSLQTIGQTVTYEESKKMQIKRLLDIKKFQLQNLTFYTSYCISPESRSVRKITDDKKFSSIINRVYKEIQDKIIELLSKYFKIEIDPAIASSECFFGILYMQILLNSQNSNIYLDDSMIEDLKKMMININNFCILNIFIYIVFYDYPKNGHPIDIQELINNNMYDVYCIEFFQKHANFTNKFNNFTYICTMLNNSIACNIKDLNNFIEFILQNLHDIKIAEDMLGLKHIDVPEYIDVSEYDTDTITTFNKDKEKLAAEGLITIGPTILDEDRVAKLGRQYTTTEDTIAADILGSLKWIFNHNAKLSKSLSLNPSSISSNTPRKSSTITSESLNPPRTSSNISRTSSNVTSESLNPSSISSNTTRKSSKPKGHTNRVNRKRLRSNSQTSKRNNQQSAKRSKNKTAKRV